MPLSKDVVNLRKIVLVCGRMIEIPVPEIEKQASEVV